MGRSPLSTSTPIIVRVVVRMVLMYELEIVRAKHILADGPSGPELLYGCCLGASSGHTEACTVRIREAYIAGVLERAGISFKTGELLTPVSDAFTASDRVWLAKFLNYAPHIDPYDDDEELVDQLIGYTSLIRICVERRDAAASRDKQSGGEPLTPTISGRFSATSPNLSNPPRHLSPVVHTLLKQVASSSLRTVVEDPRKTEPESATKPEAVVHPQHYNSHPAGIECIDVIEHMSSNVAAAMKYLWRAGLKPHANFAEDLAKAIWYIERERTRMQTPERHTAAYGGGER